MANNTPLQSLRVSGSCRIPGGQYDEVHGSGSIRIEGNVTANSFETSGSVRGQGSLKTKRFRTSGSTRVDGPVEVSDGRASGSFRVDGSFRVLDQFVLSGSTHISGAVAGERVRGSGALAIGEEVALEELNWSGSVRCPGLISADTIELRVHGTSEVGELAGAKIRVTVGKIGNWARWIPFAGAQLTRLTVSEVSGDDILLEATEAKAVRGDRVVIGPQCRIQRVEYRDSLEVDSDAFVAESIKLS